MRPAPRSSSRLLAVVVALLVGLGLVVVPAGSASAARPKGEFFVSWGDRSVGVRVTLYAEGSDTPVVPLSTRHARSYYLARLVPGTYTVCWTGGGEVQALLPRCLGADGEWVERREDAVTFQVTKDKTFVAPRIEPSDRLIAGRVAGQVLSPDGVPVRNAQVCGRRPGVADAMECTPAAATDGSGRFVMNQLSPDREVVLAASTQDGLYETSYYGDTSDADEATVVPFTPGSARHLPAIRMQERDVPVVSGTVRDSGGRPIGDAVLTARRLDDDRTYTARQGEKGRFALGLEEGTYEVTIEARGYETSVREATITGDRTQDVVLEIRKGEFGMVTAIVTYHGQPLAGATVWLRAKDYEGPKIYGGVTDVDGVYTRHDVKPGTYFAYMKYKDTHVSRELQPVVAWGLNSPRKFPVVADGAPTELAVDYVSTGGVVSLRKPSILQEPVVGSWLTIDRGVWSPSSVQLDFQWMRGRTPIPGATGSGYRPVPADAGTQLWVQVVARDRGPLASWTTSTERVTVRPKPAPESAPAAKQAPASPAPTPVPTPTSTPAPTRTPTPSPSPSTTSTR